MNLKVRMRNKTFWITLIPAVIVMVQTMFSVCGYNIDLGDLGNKLLGLVDAVFVALGVLGVVNDPTTHGLGDSEQALTYERPKKRGE